MGAFCSSSKICNKVKITEEFPASFSDTPVATAPKEEAGSLSVDGIIPIPCSTSSAIPHSTSKGRNKSLEQLPSEYLFSESDYSESEYVFERSKWKSVTNIKKMRQKYLHDNTVPSDMNDSMFELRLFLDGNELLKSLFTFMDGSRQWINLLLCWVDVKSYQVVELLAFELQRGMASDIYNKYLKIGSGSFIDIPDFDEQRANIDKVLFESDPEGPISTTLFADVQQHCFQKIYDEVWSSYQTSHLYKSAVKILKRHNQVDVDDFEYMEKLGQGGYGFVVHAKKKSTGKHYAMKIQRKLGLLLDFSDCPHRVTFERRAMAKCNHPFIMGLDYAFQTEDLAIMAMELGRCGTLADSLLLCGSEGMSEERVRFYSAEIVLGLSHMHRMGFMYRDMKPSNVLLMYNGHIKLVDLGGVVDPHERFLKANGDGETALSYLSEYAHSSNSSSKAISRDDVEPTCIPGVDTSSSKGPSSKAHSSKGHSSKGETEFSGERRHVGAIFDDHSHPSLRAYSIMGTPGYMAPEMLSQHFGNMEQTNSNGYSQAVDWWGLGITMAELFLSKAPFKQDALCNFLVAEKDAGGEPTEYCSLFSTLQESSAISEKACNIISLFLAIDESARLGYGSHGVSNIQKHEFFGELNWNRLNMLKVKPPFFPKLLEQEAVHGSSFSSVLATAGLKYRKGLDFVTGVQNKYFENWDFIAPETIKLEIGAEERGDDSFRL